MSGWIASLPPAPSGTQWFVAHVRSPAAGADMAKTYLATFAKIFVYEIYDLFRFTVQGQPMANDPLPPQGSEDSIHFPPSTDYFVTALVTMKADEGRIRQELANRGWIVSPSQFWLSGDPIPNWDLQLGGVTAPPPDVTAPSSSMAPFYAAAGVGIALGGLTYFAWRHGWFRKIGDAFDRAAALPI
jgi:hypothetical protein